MVLCLWVAVWVCGCGCVWLCVAAAFCAQDEQHRRRTKRALLAVSTEVLIIAAGVALHDAMGSPTILAASVFGPPAVAAVGAGYLMWVKADYHMFLPALWRPFIDRTVRKPRRPPALSGDCASSRASEGSVPGDAGVAGASAVSQAGDGDARAASNAAGEATSQTRSPSVESQARAGTGGPHDLPAYVWLWLWLWLWLNCVELLPHACVYAGSARTTCLQA